MGGSGGGPSFNPADYRQNSRNSNSETQSQACDIQVNSLISDLLSMYNDRDVEAIRKHLDSIKKALESDIEGFTEILFGGSIAKHTYIDGLSDVDALVNIKNTDLEGKSPNEVKQYFCDRLQQRFPKTEVSIGNLAVTLKFQDGHEIQLLPTIKQGDKLKISSSDSSRWTNINPKKFTEKLTAVNSQQGGKVVPTIKLVKSIVANYPQNRRLSGYHVEALAVDVFKNYNDRKTPKDMLKHFFKEASGRVLQPMADSTGQSLHVDGYLKGKDSLERKRIADSLSNTYRKMNKADENSFYSSWKNILTGGV